MNNSLRGSLKQLELKGGKRYTTTNSLKTFYELSDEGIDEILTLVESKMPEKIDPETYAHLNNDRYSFTAYENAESTTKAHNHLIDTFKSILRGSND